VQEAWEGITRGWRRLKDPAVFPAWAFGILHNKCRDLIRRNQRLRAREADPESAPEPAISARGEDAAAIGQALSRLSYEHRTAATLFFGEGLSLAEIARATGVPEGTVKSRLFHARQKLRADLKGESDE
jgi:RNA polymerase sigma-70 factor (ECF subfamily)